LRSNTIIFNPFGICIMVGIKFGIVLLVFLRLDKLRGKNTNYVLIYSPGGVIVMFLLYLNF